ncbi:caveolin-2 [Dendroctonus ponderosae]
MSKPESEILDLEDRDPQRINQHLEVSWDTLIGEPQSLRSPECAWTLSQYCFRFSRIGVYTCLSVLFAPIAACFVGTCYAVFYFQYIWCSVPSLWLCKATCGITRSFVRAFTHGCLIPITTGFGYVLSEIKVKTQKVQEPAETKEEDDQVFII